MTHRDGRDPQPPARPMKVCQDCGTSNEAWRRKCRNCNEELAVDPARAAAIAAIVAQAPPLTSAQLVALRRIFASSTPAREAA